MRTRRFGRVLLSGVLAASLWLPASGQPTAGSPSVPATQASSPAVAAEKLPVITFEKYTLKNGLEVILSEDHRLPLVALDLWYHVGPANEKPGRTGFAHLFEHMMFQGSKHAGDKPFQLLESAGATLINGTTNFDRTNYFETLPSNQLELGLWLEADRMGWLLDKLDEKKLANQRDVVRNERRQGESQPYTVIQEAMWHELFPKGHPYYGRVIGSHADIEAAELNDVREFFRTYYAPNNCTLAIVGDFDPKTIKGLVEKYFGPIPGGPAPEKITASQPVITQERTVTVTDKISLPRLYMSWHTPAIFQPGDAEADLLADALGSGRSSRLYKKLVYEKQIAQDVSVSQNSLQLGSVFQIMATARPGVELKDLQTAIDEELANIQRTGPANEELEKARNSIVTERIQSLQRLGGFGGVADQLNLYNHYTGDPSYLQKDIARYEAATATDVRKFAQSLTANSRVVVYGVPGDKKLEDVPQRKPDLDTQSQVMPGGPPAEPWRATAPKPGPVKVPELPAPRTFTFSNGLTVYLVEDHQLPVFSGQLVVLRGSEANPVDKPGLASFTAAMLTEGTEGRTSPQIADDIAATGGSVNGGSSADSSFVTASGLISRADRLLEILADVARNPAFREEEIERVRQRRLTMLIQQKDNPNALANRFFAKEIYGEKSPYGYLEIGTEASTKGTTREDMVNFVKAGYGPKNAALVVAGAFTQAQLQALAQKHFGGWTGTATKQPPIAVSAATRRRIVIVDKPGSPQSVLRIGHVGLERNHPDFVAVNVMNDILGGLFSSRINLNLREVHGYTYGAGSGFVFRRAQGPFQIGSMVRTDVTAASVTEIFKEVDRMRGSEPAPDEVTMAKESYIRSLPAIFETTQQTAAAMADLFIYNLPLQYYAHLTKQIEMVDTANVHQVAQKYLSPDKMVVVIAGDRAKIQDELKRLDLGPIEVVDVEGQPVK